MTSQLPPKPILISQKTQMTRDQGKSGPPSSMRIAGGALVNWWRAVTLDALMVGILWLVGLEILRVPWAPLWALLGAVFQLVPGVGGMLAVAGPAIAAMLSGEDDVFFRLCMVLGLYAIIMVLEGLVIGPYILHRTTMVPWWPSLLGPIVLGLLIPPWGVLIAPPLLAVFFALRRRKDHGVDKVHS
jgi:predicted PurR-regulated permease PerM